MTTMMHTTTTSSNKPPPRPTPLSIHYRNLPPEPCSPGNDIQLSKSLGDAFRFGSATMPLHRQTSEVSSITHSGYLYKRSNRPYQQVTPFPLDSLEITVNTTHGTLDGSTSAIEAELTPTLHPKPTSMEDVFSRDHHLVDDLNDHHHHHHNHNHNQQQRYTLYENGSGSYRRPLHFSSSMLPPDPTSTSLAARFEEDENNNNNNNNNNHTDTDSNNHYNDRNFDNLPMAPLLTPPAPDITESISTKATEPEHEYSDESPSATALLLLTTTTTTTMTESPSMQEKKRQVALEQSLNCAAAFFGIHVESAFPPSVQTTTAAASPERAPLSAPMMSGSTSKDNVLVGAATPDTDVEAMTTKTKTTTKQPTKSVPIKVNNNSNAKRELLDGSFDRHAHRRCSAPCTYDNNSVTEEGTLTSSHRSRPADYVDPKDHHLWRAKYCVLEDGVLYFYRSKEDAETQEAKQERHCSAPLTNGAFQGGSAAAAVREGAADLSKSPMASRACLVIPSVDGSLSGSNSDAESSFMWEKRVALNCVGAVRSAETEYGKNAFELLAVDDEEDDGYTNKLVLKAPKQEDMNEWIFQFHRSLASFVMNMVDLVGSSTRSPSYVLGDIHHPSFEVGGRTHSTQTPLRSFNVPAFSPRFVKHMPGPPITASLSHGHGRSQRRRRRADLANKGGFSTDSVHSVASTPTAHSPTQMPFPLANCLAAQSNLITPLKHGDLTPSEQDDLPRRFQTQQQLLMEDKSPELSAPQSANPPETERPPPPPAPAGGKYIPPHLRKQTASGSAKYVPPHLRNKEMNNNNAEAKSPPRKYVPPHLRNKGSEPNENGTAAKSNVIAPRPLSVDEREIVESSFSSLAARDPTTPNQDERPESDVTVLQVEAAFKLGGCADPLVIGGSILDQQYIEKRASKVGPVRTDAYGSLGGGQGPSSENDNTAGIRDITWSTSLEWEIGAVSECGIRESNEDAYFVTNDLVKTFSGLIESGLSPTYWDNALGHRSGVFAIFDGHCGNQAARFAAERLPHFLYEESLVEGDLRKIGPEITEGILRRAITKLDEEFCRICVQDGREWESGSTALIATIVEEHLVIANIGDCRGVLCRTFDKGKPLSHLEAETWTEVVVDHAEAKGKRCFWREVAEVHSPSRPDERDRIERAGGWTTTETEIPISQLQRMDFLDQDVIDILRRCFQDRINDSQGSKTCSSAPQRILQISRVCGELAVSRAIGDRDFKAACNMSPSSDTESGAWESSLLLPYPDEHNRQFVGDLVSNKPDFQAIRVGEADIQGEFLLLACDGLWDVMDKDDAVRVTWDLLFEKNCPSKQAAARLAELAIHLGSSDNITVIVVRFFPKKGTKS